MLDDLMPELADSDDVRQVVRLSGLELARLEDEARAASQSVLPTKASDEHGTLAMWELLLGLPVAPPGPSVEQRRSLVTASIRKLHTSSGEDWVAAITQALETDVWEHEEGPADYQITIRVGAESGYVPGQITVLARRLTPAHLTIATGFMEGFLIGSSHIGDVL